MNEIEVKFKINNLSELLSKLEESGCSLSAPIRQVDTVFMQNGIDPSCVKVGDIVIRTREQSDKTLFTLKKKRELSLNAIEIEYEISDVSKAHSALELLGFHKVLIIDKTRIKSRFDKYTIDIDSVVGLGDFVEMELLTNDDNNAAEIQNEMINKLGELGVDTSQRIFEPYDTQLYSKSHHKNNKATV